MPKLTDEHFMKKALALAEKARGMTSPNPMVGCVIVSNNRIIARGYHKQSGLAHAEINALNKLKSIPKGAVMYVTLEPCNSFGCTPPCVNEIIKRGVKKVVVAMKDPNPLTNGKSIAKMRRAGIKVNVGVLAEESALLNESFIKSITTGLPFVVTKSAQTLDGKIATRTGSSKWITSEKTREHSRKRRINFDAILVGIDTVIKDNPSLSSMTKKYNHLNKVVLDSKLRISLKAKLFKNTNFERCIIATTKKASKSKRIALERKAVEVIVCPEKDGRIDLKWLLKKLVKNGITSILIEGGAKVIGNAIKAGLVDKMHIYIAPKIVGDQNAKSSVNGLNIVNINNAVRLGNMTVEKLGKDILVKGYVLRNR